MLGDLPVKGRVVSGLPLSFQRSRKSAKSTHGRLLSDQMRFEFVSFLLLSLCLLLPSTQLKREKINTVAKRKKNFTVDSSLVVALVCVNRERHSSV